VKIPERNNLKEERLILAHGLHRFQTMISWLHSHGPVVKKSIMVVGRSGREKLLTLV
jgi:hypothetical protein